MSNKAASILLHPNAVREQTRPLPARIDPNMRQLRALVAVAQGGSVHKAASLMHLTQPAVTRAIHELEQALGLEMFARTAKGMVPTTVGAILVERLSALLRRLRMPSKSWSILAYRADAKRSVGLDALLRHLRAVGDEMTPEHTVETRR